MKFLVINYEYPPLGGGAANATYNFCELLSKNHDVTVVTTAFKDLDDFQHQGRLKIIRLKSFRAKKSESNTFEMLFFLIACSFSLSKIIKENGIDHILVFFASPFGLLGLIAKLLHDCKYSVFIRGGDIPDFIESTNIYHKLLAPLSREIYKNATNIFTNGEYLKSLTEKFLKKSLSPELKTKPVISIPNGVDLDYFYKDRKVFSKNFIFVGRLVQIQKNIMLLPELLKAIPDINIEIVGEGPDGETLKQKFLDYELSERVNFRGWLTKDELKLAYHQADFLIMPSFFEGVSNVLLEGIAANLFIISSSIAENITSLNNYPKSKIIADHQTESYIKAIREIIDSPKKYHINLLKESLVKFSWTARIKALEQYLLQSSQQG